jgi:hypothetical protein
VWFEENTFLGATSWTKTAYVIGVDATDCAKLNPGDYFVAEFVIELDVLNDWSKVAWAKLRVRRASP